MAKPYTIPTLPLEFDLETKEVLRQLTQSSRALAELNGVAQKNTKREYSSQLTGASGGS